MIYPTGGVYMTGGHSRMLIVSAATIGLMSGVSTHAIAQVQQTARNIGNNESVFIDGRQQSYGGLNDERQRSYGGLNDRQQSYGGLNDDRQRSYGGLNDRQQSYGGLNDRQQSYGGLNDRQQSYGGLTDADITHLRG